MQASRGLSMISENAEDPEGEDNRRQPIGGLGALTACASLIGYDAASFPLEDPASSLPESEVYGFSTCIVTCARVLHLDSSVHRRFPQAHLIAGSPPSSALPHQTQPYFDFVPGERVEASDTILGRIQQEGMLS